MTPESVQLLKKLYDAGDAVPVYMTKEEGAELLNAGYLVVNPEKRDPLNSNAFHVEITNSGLNAIPKPTFVLQQGIPVPSMRRGAHLSSKESTYPFDTMGVGDSFHVKCTHRQPEPWKQLASSVSAANTRSHVGLFNDDGTPLLHNKERRTLIRNGSNEPVLNAEGKRQFDKLIVTEQKSVATKRFIARRVSGSGESPDPDGDGVRVFREELAA